jgi:energy-coupling factor transporter ATP-binding protein EcfA2
MSDKRRTEDIKLNRAQGGKFVEMIGGIREFAPRLTRVRNPSIPAEVAGAKFNEERDGAARKQLERIRNGDSFTIRTQKEIAQALDIPHSNLIAQLQKLRLPKDPAQQHKLDKTANQYRQYIVNRFRKLTLFSATSKVAVDLEQIFVELSAVGGVDQQIMRDSREGELNPEDRKEGDRSLLEQEEQAALPPSPRGEISIHNALRLHSCMVLIGTSGAGKTTLLKYIALAFARRKTQDQLHLNESRLPFYVALRDFGNFLNNRDKRGQLGELGPTLLTDFLYENAQDLAPQLKLPRAFILRALEEKRSIVLFDGLDEVDELNKRYSVTEVVARAITHYEGNRFVLTSRPHGFGNEARQMLIPPSSEYRIREFSVGDRARFAQAWYKAIIVNEDGNTPAALNKASAASEDLLRNIEQDGRISPLANNPLLLAILALVYIPGKTLPTRRAVLYNECTQMLLGYWDQTKGGGQALKLAEYRLESSGGLRKLTSRDEMCALLMAVALWMHERGERHTEVSQNDLEGIFATEIQKRFGETESMSRQAAKAFLLRIVQRSGLLEERKRGSFSFAHLTFQEYLAARALGARADYIEYTLHCLPDPWWREVIVLEISHLSSPNDDRSREVVRKLLDAIRQAAVGSSHASKRNLLLACRALADTDVLGVDIGLRKILNEKLLDLWKESYDDEVQSEIAKIFAITIPSENGKTIRNELLRCLNGESQELRVAALRTLARMGETAAMPDMLSHLVALTAVCNPKAACAAIGALAGMGSASRTPEVLDCLELLTTSNDYMVRCLAKYAVLEITSGPSLKEDSILKVQSQ